MLGLITIFNIASGIIALITKSKVLRIAYLISGALLLVDDIKTYFTAKDPD